METAVKTEALTAPELGMWIRNKVNTPYGTGVLIGVSTGLKTLAHVDMPGGMPSLFNVADVMPVVRPVSSMSHQEAMRFVMLQDKDYNRVKIRKVCDTWGIQFQYYKANRTVTQEGSVSFARLTPAQLLLAFELGLDALGWESKGQAITQ